MRAKIITIIIIFWFGIVTLILLDATMKEHAITQDKLDQIEASLDDIKMELMWQSIETEDLQDDDPDMPEHISLGQYTITHYCSCSKCCGKSDGITASGTVATEGRTIAVDPDVIPYGTQVMIDGHTYIAEDRGGAVKGQKIDIYVDSHEEALSRGKIKREVYIDGL